MKFFNGSFYICGFMAAGKTTFGEQMAEYLSLPFKDLDDEIEEYTDKSIPLIFSQEGEEYFRMVEQKVLLRLSHDFKGVVSLGGGALQNQHIVDHLKVTGLLIYLKAPIDHILKRVLDSGHRPILKDDDGKEKSPEALRLELKDLYSKREKFYKQADVTLIQDPEGSAEEQLEKWIQKIMMHV